jgi:carboxyl-terminal processing protease
MTGGPFTPNCEKSGVWGRRGGAGFQPVPSGAGLNAPRRLKACPTTPHLVPASRVFSEQPRTSESGHDDASITRAGIATAPSRSRLRFKAGLRSGVLLLLCGALAFGVPPLKPSAPERPAAPGVAPVEAPTDNEKAAAEPKRPAGQPLPNTAELETELGRFMSVFSAIDGSFADPVSSEQLLYGGAIPGMLRVLDPHSIFFNKDQFEQLEEMQHSVAKGFGSVVSVMPGRVIVLQTQMGSPSQRSGLLPGDEILGVNNIPLARLDLDQLIEVLSATRQHQALLAVRRQGTAGLMSFTLVPAQMQTASVDRMYRLDGDTAYVRVTSFEPKTGEQLKEAIEKLGGAKLKGLVLDLRDNPGGVVTAGLQTAALFLKPGTRLFSARGRSTETENVDVPPGLTPYDFKLAVIVNSKTASAAEIVAGALQDNDRATIYGEQTYGKGLVQRVYPLRDTTGLALTTAFYYTPSGRSLQKPLYGSELEQRTRTMVRPEFKTAAGRTVRGGGGIEPDVAVESYMPGRFGLFLETSALYPAFATDWIARHRSEVKREMEITPALLDDFHQFLSERNVTPSVGEWTGEREEMSSRLKQEILNQSLGVEAGDEIEVQRDPAVRRALLKFAE